MTVLQGIKLSRMKLEYVMIKREDDGIWIELEETIAAHHELVFACLSTAGGLTRWFTVAAEVEARAGGLIKLGWDEKMTRTTTVAILDFDEDGWIVWDWYAGPQDVHAPVYWKVSPNVEEGSRVQLRQGPFDEDVESMMAMAEQLDSWRWHLCNLRGVLEAKHDMRAVRPL